MHFLRKNKLFLFYFYLSVLLLVGSTWTRQVFQFQPRVYQLVTVMAYLPFAAAIICKFIYDIKTLKNRQHRLLDYAYYVFLIYFGALTITRFIRHTNIKVGIYYTLIIAGSIAIFQLISFNRLKIDAKEFVLNNKLLGTAIVIYSLLCFAFVGNVFPFPPININITGTLVVMLLPAIATFLEEKLTSKTQTVWSSLLLTAFVVIVVTSGSRAIFWLFAVTLIVLIVVSIGDKQRLFCVLSSVLVSVTIVGVLFSLNVGAIRYSVSRETGINVLSSGQANPTKSAEKVPAASAKAKQNETPPVSKVTENSTAKKTVVSSSAAEKQQASSKAQAAVKQSEAEAQISRSDAMRSDLLKIGLDQIKQNPWFGTGLVLNEYKISGYVFKQAPHNFIVETIVCYGIVGLILLAFIIVMIITQCGLFSKWTSKNFRLKVSIILICLCYFAVGFVEPIMYDILVCPHFFLLLSCYKLLLQENQKELSSTT